MSELFIVVGLKAKAGKEDELRRDLSVLVEPSRNENGKGAFLHKALSLLLLRNG